MSLLVLVIGTLMEMLKVITQKIEYNEENQVIGQTSTEYEYALNNLKVGDMPQTAYVGGLTVKPIDGLRVQGLYRWYDNHYSDWSPDSREVEGDA